MFKYIPTILYVKFYSVIKLALFCLFAIPFTAYSQDGVLIVTSSDNAIYKKFQSALINKLPKNIKISQIVLADINQETLNQHNLIITAGYNAAKKLSSHKPSTPVIYSFIPEYDNKASSPACDNNCYKIYINQPTPRYIKLFNILFPSGKNLVIAANKSSADKTQNIIAAANRSETSIKVIQINDNSNITRTFINNLTSNDVLLALPNPEIYNAHTAKNIILSTYHSNVPIIAYSKSFAKAGALVSLYSGIEHIADKTANIAIKILNNNPPTEYEFYPDDFTLEINSAVARSLNINIDTESSIKRKMR